MTPNARQIRGGGYLVMNERGKTRLAVKYPKLKAGEIVVHLSIAVPHSLFVRPVLSVTATLPADAALSAITVDVSAELAEAVRAVVPSALRVELTRAEE